MSSRPKTGYLLGVAVILTPDAQRTVWRHYRTFYGLRMALRHRGPWAPVRFEGFEEEAADD